MLIVILFVTLFFLLCAAVVIAGLICWASGTALSLGAVALVWLLLLIAFVAVGGSDEYR